MSDDRDFDNAAGLDRHVEADLREMLVAAAVAGLDEHTSPRAHLAVEVAGESSGALGSQAPRAILDGLAPHLRHACGGRARPRREREDMQISEPARVDEVERTGEH